MSTLSDIGVKRKTNKNRNSLEIVRDMLSAASEKAKKTRIMYRANLSYRLMEKYLNTILESGLVECDDDSCYMVTWRGKEFLQMYEDYLERCRRIGKDIKGAREDRLQLENICFNNENNAKRMINDKRVLV
ncbi:MAG: hypothetical protein JSV29_00735 [Candidatus Bathyarchaeota archaeon]|nr:MAG: hypothetical protein JSV29_00735 [Candidatus Bathyarchaeota archaeon]